MSTPPPCRTESRTRAHALRLGLHHLGVGGGTAPVGLVMVTSASMSIAARDLGNPFYFLERQFVFGAAGLVFAWILTRVPAELWDKYSLALLCAALLLLLLVLVPGIGAMVNGARRWAARRTVISRCRNCPGAGAHLGVQLLRTQARRAGTDLAGPREAGIVL